MLRRYSSVFIDMAFIGDRNMAAASIGRIIIGAFWIIRMPSMVFDVILSVLGVLSRYVLYLLLF